MIRFIQPGLDELSDAMARGEFEFTIGSLGQIFDSCQVTMTITQLFQIRNSNLFPASLAGDDLLSFCAATVAFQNGSDRFRRNEDFVGKTKHGPQAVKPFFPMTT
jgi:hypothetical protein